MLRRVPQISEKVPSHPVGGIGLPGIRRKSGAIGAAASIRTSCDCDSGNLRERRLQADPMHAPRVEQPVVHYLPLVPASCLEIQQCRSRVLQLYKELQRVSTGRLAGIDGLRLDPLVPFPDDQTPRSFLFHGFPPNTEKTARRRSLCCSPDGQQIRLRERPHPPITTPSPETQSKRDAQALLSQNACSTSETRQALPERHNAHSSFHRLLDQRLIEGGLRHEAWRETGMNIFERDPAPAAGLKDSYLNATMRREGCAARRACTSMRSRMRPYYLRSD